MKPSHLDELFTHGVVRIGVAGPRDIMQVETRGQQSRPSVRTKEFTGGETVRHDRDTMHTDSTTAACVVESRFFGLG
jgi:hypothetical protein